MKAVLHLPKFIADEKGLASREVEGEVVRHTEKGVLLKGHAVIGASDTCRRCGRRITHPASLLVGYGPECSQHLGIPREFSKDELDTVVQQAQRHTEVEAWFPRRYVVNDWQPDEDEEREGFTMKVTPWVSKFQVEFPYRRDVVEDIKQIPGRSFDGKRKCWFVPWEGGEQLAEVYEKHTGQPAPDCIETLVSENQEYVRVRTQASKATTAKLDVKGLGGELRPFQKAGVEYALRTKTVIIGDEMGLGKTVQALATVWSAQAFPLVVVCPASLKLNWQRESIKWLPTASTQVVNGSCKPKPNVDVTIINYDIVGKHLVRLPNTSVILDELHYIKNQKAKRSQYVADLCQHSEYILGLTGTAILNRPIELAHPLKVLRHIDKFGGFWRYAQRYCGAYRDRFGWRMDGATNLKELNDKLRVHCYIRREKSQVLKELPPKTKAIVNLPIDNRKEYQRAVDDLIEYLREEAARMAQLQGEDGDRAGADAARRAAAAEHLVRLNTLKQLAAKGKLDAATEWIENFLASGEKLVVFAHHKSIVRTVAEKFNAPYIGGSVSTAKRQEHVDRFQNDPSCQLIVLNLQAGGVGINLWSASNVAFLELGWTPGAHQQAEDRVHRMNQTNRVTAWYLLASGTIDETVAELLDKKQHVTNAVNIGEEAEVSEGILNALLNTLRKEN